MPDDTPGSQIFRFELHCEFLTEIENILTHWLVAKAGLNDEKTGGRKPRWTVPLRTLKRAHYTVLADIIIFKKLLTPTNTVQYMYIHIT